MWGGVRSLVGVGLLALAALLAVVVWTDGAGVALPGVPAAGGTGATLPALIATMLLLLAGVLAVLERFRRSAW